MTQSGPPTQQPAPPPPAGWAPPPQPAVGPAGLVYADVPNRAIAYIIDAIILFIINVIVAIILGAVGLNSVTTNLNTFTVNYNPVAGLISAVIFTAINGIYFIYTWRSLRASPGQRVL